MSKKFNNIIVDLTEEDLIRAAKIVISNFDDASRNIFESSSKTTEEEIMKAVYDSVVNEGVIMAIKRSIEQNLRTQ